MGLEIEYTGDDGRKYESLAEMLQAEGSKLIDDTMTEVQRAIEAQRCPLHGRGPSATMTRSGDRISFEIEGCCDDLVERAQRAGEEALA
jgi:hypothetical protein